PQRLGGVGGPEATSGGGAVGGRAVAIGRAGGGRLRRDRAALAGGDRGVPARPRRPVDERVDVLADHAGLTVAGVVPGGVGHRVAGERVEPGAGDLDSKLARAVDDAAPARPAGVLPAAHRGAAGRDLALAGAAGAAAAVDAPRTQ